MAESTGLRSPSGPARARVIDRAGWVQRQRRLVPAPARPHPRTRWRPTGRLAAAPTRRRAGSARQLAGVGALGDRRPSSASSSAWMSTRVLGQYDLLLTDERRRRDQDVVYFVGPNVVALEAAARLRPGRVPAVAGPPRGDPPLPVHGRPVDARATSCSLVEAGSSRSARSAPAGRGAPPGRRRDPGRAEPAAGRRRPRARRDARAARGPPAHPGADEPARGPRRRDHGPGRGRRGARAPPASARCCGQRREQARGPARLLQQILGLEAKFRQYAEGEQLRARRSRRRAAAGSSTASGRAPSGCPPWSRSATRRTWVRRVGARGPGRVTLRPSSGPPRPAWPGRWPRSLGALHLPPAGTPLVCAVSGGPDSLALLVLAVAAGCRVTAVHVDHGLRPGSADEADVVADAAAALRRRLPGRAGRVVAEGPNLEARARAARFAVLPADVATGHTMDDQAETVLVQPAARRRARRPGRHGAGPPAPAARPAPPRDRGALRGRSGSTRSATRQRRPAATCATGSATSCCPLCCGDRPARPGPGARPPGRRCSRDDAALPRRPGRRWRCPDPSDARALARRPGRPGPPGRAAVAHAGR